MAHHDTLLHSIFGDDIVMRGDRPQLSDEKVLQSDRMDRLVRAAVFGETAERERARWLIWQIGQAVGVRAASIHELYMARGRGEVGGFTVPAINVRGSSYETARSIFRTANKLEAGAFILEIARSEIVYTEQRPGEYVAVMLAAAMREGFRGPVFIQGDHFQVNAKKYAAGAEAEVEGVKALAREAIAAGFYNIDIDTSTLVDLSKPSHAEQQRLNYEVGIDILKEVRSLEPEGVTISVGGEIGEVGTENSTVEELEAQVEHRTRELMSMNQELGRAFNRMADDLGIPAHADLRGPEPVVRELPAEAAGDEGQALDGPAVDQRAGVEVAERRPGSEAEELGLGGGVVAGAAPRHCCSCSAARPCSAATSTL